MAHSYGVTGYEPVRRHTAREVCGEVHRKAIGLGTIDGRRTDELRTRGTKRRRATIVAHTCVRTDYERRRRFRSPTRQSLDSLFVSLFPVTPFTHSCSLLLRSKLSLGGQLQD